MGWASASRSRSSTRSSRRSGCADGRYLVFFSVRFHHLERFLDALGLRGWAAEGVADYDRLRADPTLAAALKEHLAALFATRPAKEWEEFARAHGCAVGMLRSA